MAKINYDGVLETARFKPDGQLDWVRVYMRLGSVFSDRIILSRQAFVEQLKGGKRYMVGQRILKMGGKFNVTKPVILARSDGKEVIAVGKANGSRDELPGVPVV